MGKQNQTYAHKPANLHVDPVAKDSDPFWWALQASEFQECSVSSHHLLDPDETQASLDDGPV